MPYKDGPKDPIGPFSRAPCGCHVLTIPVKSYGHIRVDVCLDCYEAGKRAFSYLRKAGKLSSASRKVTHDLCYKLSEYDRMHKRLHAITEALRGPVAVP